MSTARYFTVAERLAQPTVSSIELMPSPSMYDELLRPLWWAPDGLRRTGADDGDYVLPCGCVPPCEGHHEDES